MIIDTIIRIDVILLKEIINVKHCKYKKKKNRLKKKKKKKE